MNQLPPKKPQESTTPKTPEEKVSHIGLVTALALGVIALIVLAAILLFRSQAAFGPPSGANPFFFGSTPTPTASTIPFPSTSPTVSPTLAPTPLTPSPSGAPHSVIITNLGISQMFGGSTTNPITLTPGASTTVYIQGSASHTPNPPTCAAVSVAYAGTTVSPSCTASPGFQIATSLSYSTVCSGITPGNQTSWSVSVTATDTDSSASATGSTTATIQC